MHHPCALGTHVITSISCNLLGHQQGNLPSVCLWSWPLSIRLYHRKSVAWGAPGCNALHQNCLPLISLLSRRHLAVGTWGQKGSPWWCSCYAFRLPDVSMDKLDSILVNSAAVRAADVVVVVTGGDGALPSVIAGERPTARSTIVPLVVARSSSCKTSKGTWPHPTGREGARRQAPPRSASLARTASRCETSRLGQDLKSCCLPSPHLHEWRRPAAGQAPMPCMA